MERHMKVETALATANVSFMIIPVGSNQIAAVSGGRGTNFRTVFLKRNVDERKFEIWLYVGCNVLIKSLLSLQARVQQLLQINANQINEIQNLQSVVSSNFQQCWSLFTFTVLSKRQWFSLSVLFRMSLTWTLLFDGWLELAYELFPFQPSGRGGEGKGVLRVSSSRVSRSRYLLAKRKRRRRRAKAWKEKESHACLSRASLFPLPFCLAEEARETREGMEGKGLPRASSVSITF